MSKAKKQSLGGGNVAGGGVGGVGVAGAGGDVHEILCYKPKDLVWAKMKGFAPWPAMNNNATTITERYCCEGFYLNGTKCESFCKKPCLQGICNETGECVCKPDFIFDNISEECQPVRHIKCETGKSIDLSVCECNPGYEFNTDAGKCEPVCNALRTYDFNETFWQLSCKIANCFTYGNFNETIKTTNLPAASTKNCGFGICTSPDVCQCHNGYVLNKHTNICQPMCPKRCPLNSKCVRPNICACKRGYKLDPSSKKWRCKSLNSKIFSYSGSVTKESNPTWNDIMRKMLQANKCEKGYTYNKESEKCLPSCHNNCLHGNCTAPDVCVCFPGYSLDLHIQVCVANACKSACPNGYCVDTGECVCPQGLTKSLLRASGCEELLAHTTKVLLVFLSVSAVIAVIIWLITIAERRRENV